MMQRVVKAGAAFRGLGTHIQQTKNGLGYAGYLGSINVYENNNHPTSLTSKRYFRITPKRESALIVGGISLLAAAVTAQYAHQLYVSMKENNGNANSSADGATSSNDGATTSDETKQEAKANSKADDTKNSQEASSSSSSSTTNSWFARNFYEGGFEEKMSRREAALILGVRESAAPERIKDAHRRILLLNHPDRGGSAFIAAKINEAKDILMKGK